MSAKESEKANDKLVSPMDFAYKTGMSITHVYKLMKRGEVKFVKADKGFRTIAMIPELEISKFGKKTKET